MPRFRRSLRFAFGRSSGCGKEATKGILGRPVLRHFMALGAASSLARQLERLFSHACTCISIIIVHNSYAIMCSYHIVP